MAACTHFLLQTYHGEGALHVLAGVHLDRWTALGTTIQREVNARVALAAVSQSRVTLRVRIHMKSTSAQTKMPRLCTS
jgi:hypothetical protein